jgi:hypothetical protein
MQDKPLPAEKMSLWVLAFITYLVLGPFAALATFIPNYSSIFLILSILLTTIGAIGAILVGRKRRRLGQLLFANAFFLLFLMLGARAWLKIVGNVSLWAVWMVLILIAYCLAWALPSLNPKISGLLWKEQYSPETKIGKLLLKISAVILPIAGTGGAFIGMYSSNDSNRNQAMLFIGIAACLVSIGLAQLTSHQFWREDHLGEQHSLEKK